MDKSYVFRGSITEVSEPKPEPEEEKGGVLRSLAAGAVIATWIAGGPIAGIVAAGLFGALAGSDKE